MRAALALVLLCSMPAMAADSFVLVARAQPNDSLAAAAVRDLFLGRMRTWPRGRPVELALPPPDSPEMTWLAEKIFQLTGRELRLRIRQKVFAGEMPEPRNVDSAEDCLEFVRRSRGGVCIVPRASGEMRAASIGMLTVAE
jgi:hypothetical protein